MTVMNSNGWSFSFYQPVEKRPVPPGLSGFLMVVVLVSAPLWKWLCVCPTPSSNCFGAGVVFGRPPAQGLARLFFLSSTLTPSVRGGSAARRQPACVNTSPCEKRLCLENMSVFPPRPDRRGSAEHHRHAQNTRRLQPPTPHLCGDDLHWWTAHSRRTLVHLENWNWRNLVSYFSF